LERLIHKIWRTWKRRLWGIWWRNLGRVLFRVKSKKYHWGGYVRIENGEDTVDKIDQQDGWIGKETTFRVELFDLKSGSKVGYMCPQSWLHTCQMIIGLHIGR
jgi:hypothetical protein